MSSFRRAWAATRRATVGVASNINDAVGNGTKPFAGSCAAPPCPSGSTVLVANSTNLKSTSAMSFGLPDLLASLVDTRRAPKIPTFDVVNKLVSHGGAAHPEHQRLGRGF